MRRRAFVLGSAALAAMPLAHARQPGRSYRVGTLFPFDPEGGKRFIAALRDRLATHGFVEGRNLVIDARHSYYARSAAQSFAREYEESGADAIFALTTIATLGARDATKTVPIVFAWVGDPVFSGIVETYARPGGNATGVSNRFFELYRKRLELARDLVPGAKRIAVVAGVFDETLKAAWKLAEPAAAQLGVEPVRVVAAFDWAGSVRRARDAGANVIMVTTPFTHFGMHAQAAEFVASAARERMPVVYSDSDTVRSGGLVSYATDLHDELRRGADVLARVLKGESPASIAVDQAARFELVVNLKAARAIGFTVPQSILLRADRVIE